MNRREVRKHAFEILFQKCFRDVIYEDIVENSEFEINDDIMEIVNGVDSHMAEIDKIIADYSPVREFSRIAKVNLTILRISIYEMLYDELMPTNAAIQEAVTLCENYSYDEEDRKFINGLLGRFSDERNIQ